MKLPGIASLQRNHLVLAGVVIVAAAALCALSVQGVYAGFNGDDAYYLLLADKFYGRLQDTPVLARALVENLSYPPIYPFWLGALGGGSGSIAAAYLANALAVVAAGVAFIVFLRRNDVGFAATVGLLAAFFSAPVILRFGIELWSENLYLFWQFLALALLARRSSSHEVWLGAALACCLATLTNTAGFALVAAFLLRLIVERPPRWMLAAAIASVPPVLERMLQPGHGHGGLAMPDFDALHRLATGLGSDSSAYADLAPWIAAALIATAIPAYVGRVRRASFDAILVVFYLAMLLAWDHGQPAARTLYPLMPLLLFYAWSTAAKLTSRIAAPIPAQTFAAAALAMVVGVPSVIHVAQRLALPAPPGLRAFARSSLWLMTESSEQVVETARLRKGMIEDMEMVAVDVAADECVVTEFPPVAMLFAHRRAEPAPWHDLRSAAAATDWPCRYYYVVNSMRGPGELSAAEFQEAFEVLYTSPTIPAPGAPPTGMLLDIRAKRAQDELAKVLGRFQ